MGRAIAARIQGDDYQIQWFWMQICRLFFENTKVERVAFETDIVRVFDDVAVFYGEGMFDEYGNPLRAEFYQLKFHVTPAGAFTVANLVNPSFINATSVSLLQRLRDAQRQHAQSGTEAQFIVHSPWGIHPDDLLAQIVSETSNGIDWWRLDDGGKRTKLACLRKEWRAHLEIATDAELATVLRPLRIRRGRSLLEARHELNLHLYRAGLKVVEEGARVNPYDDLARKLLQQGCTSFTRDEILRILREERLWRGTPGASKARQVGVRSFLRYAERLEDETDVMLNLLDHFDGAKIKQPASWAGTIFPQLAHFLDQQLAAGQPLRLHLHAHGTIAVATGYILEPKAGIDVAVLQTTPTDRETWRPERAAHAAAYSDWVFKPEPAANEGSDVALVLNVTLDICDEVRAYVLTRLPQVKRIIWATIGTGPSNTVVEDGPHANFLAQQLAAAARSSRTIEERDHPLHLFAAAPNGLLFFTGRLLRAIGPCVLYEYVRGSPPDARYQPSLRLPLVESVETRPIEGSEFRGE